MSLRALARPLMFGLVLAFAASCGDRSRPARPAAAQDLLPAAPPAPPPVDDADDPPAREDGHLPRGATPEHYALSFRVTPGDERFTGTTKIDVKLERPARAIVLHGANLHVTRVSAISGPRELYGSSHTRAAKGARAEEELVLTFAEPLPAGAATLAIEYDAPFDKELSGLYRVKEKDKYYAFTQFEATYARRAFPCFDEPGWKTPFDVSIRAPWGLLAVANTKEIDRVTDGDGNVFRFATTRPLPTYLIAFAVGDLEVREGPKSPVPIRAITVKGKKEQAALAIEATTKLLAALTDYLQVPYPYDKLDIVAVPDFAAGAMENAGFVTFREELLLLTDAAPRRQKRGQAQVIAHELAHQWFGDLVTASWWDELFLNEGFATWMEDAATDRVYPGFGARLDSELEMSDTFDLDALPSTRAVRQPARTSGEILEAFDGITYRKGASLLAMLEAYLGRDVFQRGVRDYLTRFAHKTASTKDLVASLEEASQKALARIVDPLTDRAGVPLVRVALACEKKPAKTTATFELAEWTALGDDKKPAPTWNVPVCYQLGKSQGCVELAPRQPVVREEPGACTAWLDPNRDHGYYRYALTRETWLALARASRSLDVATRVELVANAYAAVRSGDLPADALFELLPLMDGDHERHVVTTVVSVLSGLSKSAVSDAARPAFEAFVRARLSGHARVYAAKKKLADDDVLGKRTVEVALATLGNDAPTNERMDALARAWLKDHRAVDPDLAQAAVENASRRAGEARFAELQRAAQDAKEPAERLIAIRGLAGFDDPALLDKAFDLGLAGSIKSQDLHFMLGSALARRTSRAHAAEYVLTHWEDFKKRLPADLAPELVRVVATACTRAEVERLATFVEPRAKEMDGAERPYLAAVERARQCARVREQAEAQVLAELTKKRR